MMTLLLLLLLTPMMPRGIGIPHCDCCHYCWLFASFCTLGDYTYRDCLVQSTADDVVAVIETQRHVDDV